MNKQTNRLYSNQDLPNRKDPVLEELRRIGDEQRRLRRMFDEAIGAYLRAKFPFGKPTDRWAR